MGRLTVLGVGVVAALFVAVAAHIAATLTFTWGP